jgi:hypothetical protein
MAPVGIANVGAKGSDLNLCAIGHDKNDAEARTHIDTRGEELLHASRMGVGSDIVILGLASQHEIANATAHKIGLKSGSVQRTADIRRQRECEAKRGERKLSPFAADAAPS